MPNYKKLTERLAELYPTIQDSQLILRNSKIKTTRIAFNASAEINWMIIIDYVYPRDQLLQLVQTVIDRENDDSILEYALEETEVVPMKDAAKVFNDVIEKSDGILKESLKQLVLKGRLEEVLTQLRDSAKLLDAGDYENQIILAHSRVNDLSSKYQNGLISESDYTVRKNKLRSTVIYLIDELDGEKEIKLILKGISSKDTDKVSVTGLNVIDQVEFEKVMDKHKEIMPIEWLYNAIDSSRFICKVELNDGSSGTGFLLKGGYVMTNHHVICKHSPDHETKCSFECKNTNECPNRARVLLNYRDGQEFFTYDLDPVNGYFINKELDYSVIKIKDDPKKPLIEWGYASFETFKKPQINNLVNIIQHPEGELKKIAMPDTVLSVWEEKNYLFYSANTKNGASGSPVFNQDWQVVALHHAGVKAVDGGMTINAAGDRAASNRGILIGSIIADLKSKGFIL